MNPDDRLNALFRAARADESAPSPSSLGFEARLRARLREEARGEVLLGRLAWRFAPLCAGAALAAGLWFFLTPSPPPADLLALTAGEQQALSYLLTGE